jgi:hypothetical protein
MISGSEGEAFEEDEGLSAVLQVGLRKYPKRVRGGRLRTSADSDRLAQRARPMSVASGWFFAAASRFASEFANLAGTERPVISRSSSATCASISSYA